MILPILAACGPSKTSSQGGPHTGSTDHTGDLGAESPSPAHTGSCDSGYPADGTPVPVDTPTYDVGEYCLQGAPIESICAEIGWTELFGGCPTWDQLRDGIIDGTVTTINGYYPIYPPDDLTVYTCSAADGDWHHLYLQPYEVYDAGGVAYTFDGAGAFAGYAEYAGYWGGWCCGAEVVYGLWTGDLPPSDWACDGGTALAPAGTP